MALKNLLDPMFRIWGSSDLKKFDVCLYKEEENVHELYINVYLHSKTVKQSIHKLLFKGLF